MKSRPKRLDLRAARGVILPAPFHHLWLSIA